MGLSCQPQLRSTNLTLTNRARFCVSIKVQYVGTYIETHNNSLCISSCSVEDYTSGYMPSLAMVYSNGRVFWGPVVRFRSSCKIDITFFPFDDQVDKIMLCRVGQKWFMPYVVFFCKSLCRFV